MAKLISPVFSQIKGSIGNTTFYDTPDNPICGRSRVSPFNPSSNHQLISRLSFATAVGTWPLLSSPQRATYHDLATSLKASFPSMIHTANGRSLFCRFFSVQELFFRQGLIVFNNAINIDQPYVSETPQTIAEITPLIAPGTGFILTIYNFHTSQLTAIIEFSPSQRLVINSFSEGFNWNLSQSTTIEAAGGPGDPGVNVLHYTGLELGKAYFVRVRLLAHADDPCNWCSLPVVVRGETNRIT